ncbi:MAG: phosphatase PAP2 family protein [Actinomycetota bacterium]|nr:phosphatase PAP2 family protein [Actinomycetota bacterium]
MRPVRRTVAVLLLLGLGVALGLYVRNTVPTADQAVLNFALIHRTATRTSFFHAVTLCGGTPAATAVTAVVALIAAWRRWWALTGKVAVAGLGAAVLVVVGKSAFGRSRPPAATQLGVLQSLSYPSGHALGSTVAAILVLALVFAATRAGLWRALAVLLMAVYVVGVGLSRLYLGVHWGSDVLGGWAIGAAWALLCLGLPAPPGRDAHHDRAGDEVGAPGGPRRTWGRDRRPPTR